MIQRLIAVRLVQGLVALLIVSVVVFAASRATGNPADLLLPPDASQEQRVQIIRAMGLDKPLPEQYFQYMAHLIRGDFGQSVRSRQPVAKLYMERLPATLELGFAAILLAALLSFPLGILAALKKNSFVDWLSRIICTMGIAMPVFWLGLVLVQLFAVSLGWFATGGSGGLRYLVLPAVTLGMALMAGIARLLRSGMLDVLDTEYIKMLRIKGLAERKTIYIHALRNAAIAPVTLLGQYTALILGGAVVVETIFAWPGVGNLAYDAIGTRDFPVIQGVILINAAILILANLAVDVLNAYIDPRARAAV